MPRDFIPSLTTTNDTARSDALWFVFSGYRLLVSLSGEKVEIPASSRLKSCGLKITRQIFLGSYLGHPCYAAEGMLRNNEQTHTVFRELRSLFEILDDAFYDIALLAIHLVEWDKRNQFCSRCREELTPCKDVRAKECKACGLLDFPRISPAIIVLIEKEDSVLLARSARFPGDFFSVLAGFVEPGECLEEAIHREVKEETGITIKNIVYFGSQPWPFPDSLMIGFTAEYESGEILIDGEEIIEADWFRFDALPKLPGKRSIARRLIDDFFRKHAASIHSTLR